MYSAIEGVSWFRYLSVLCLLRYESCQLVGRSSALRLRHARLLSTTGLGHNACPIGILSDGGGSALRLRPLYGVCLHSLFRTHDRRFVRICAHLSKYIRFYSSLLQPSLNRIAGRGGGYNMSPPSEPPSPAPLPAENAGGRNWIAGQFA